MQRVTEFDIDIYKGDDFEQTFQMQNLDGTVFDLTGWHVVAEMREKKARTANLIARFTTEILSPTTGVVYLKLSDVKTTAFTQKKGYYDMLFMDTDNRHKTLIIGDVTIYNTVTLPSDDGNVTLPILVCVATTP